MRYLVLLLVSSIFCRQTVDLKSDNKRSRSYEKQYKDYLNQEKKNMQNILQNLQKIKQMDTKQREKQMADSLSKEDIQDDQEEQIFEKENMMNFKTQSILSRQQIKYIEKMDGVTSKYNIQLESGDIENLYLMVKKVPDEIKVLLMILANEDSKIINDLQVVVLDKNKEQLIQYKGKNNYYIHLEAVEPGQYQIIVKNKGPYAVNLMIMSQQRHTVKDVQKIDKLYDELQKHLQNETYALSSSTQAEIAQYLLKNSIKKLKKANSIDTFVEKKIQIKAESICYKKIDYKFMVFAVLECLAIIACTIIQMQAIKNMFRGRSII